MKDELDYCDAGKILPILERARKAKMSTADIASELGISTQALFQIEKGDTKELKPATARAIRRMDRRLK